MRDIITGQMSSLSSLQAGDRPLKRRDIKSTSLLLMVLLALIVARTKHDESQHEGFDFAIKYGI